MAKFDKDTEDKKQTASKGKKGGRKPNSKRGGKNDATKSKAASPAKGAPVTTSSALLQAAANISFPTTTGYPINVVRDPMYAIINGDPELRIPGLIRFGYVPTFGIMTNWSDPVNAWIREIYAYIRHQNSGHTNYDAASLGQYFLLYRSSLDFLYWMQRLYGVVNGAYVPQNAYTPAAIVAECGGKYTDLLTNLAQLRFYIVSFASRLYQLRVPNLKFFSEGIRLVSNIFADCEISKASFYVFDPDGFWTMHVGETAEDTYLSVTPKPEEMTVSQIMNMGENLLNSLLNSEDFNIMSGDIIKAYSEFAPVPIIDEAFVISPVYDPGFLWAIHNAGWIRNSPADARKDIRNWKILQNVQDGPKAGCLEFINRIDIREDTTAAFNHMELGQIWFRTQNLPLDLPTDQPTAGEVGFASRFMLSLERNPAYAAGLPSYSIASCQSEVLTSATMRANPFSVAHSQLIPDNYSVLHKFDMHPMVPDVTADFDPSTGDLAISIKSGILFGDVTNCTVLAPSTKANIDMAVMLDIFGDSR